MPDDLDSVRIGIQLDRAEESGAIETDVAATLRGLVAAEPALRDRLRQAVEFLECQMMLILGRNPGIGPDDSPWFAFIAEFRGETPEATLARLRPAWNAGPRPDASVIRSPITGTPYPAVVYIPPGSL